MKKQTTVQQSTPEVSTPEVSTTAQPAIEQAPLPAHLQKFAGMTPAEAKALLAAQEQKRSEAAKKAHATRAANGTASLSAKKAHATRKEQQAYLKQLAATA